MQLACRIKTYDEKTIILWMAYGDHTNYNVTYHPHLHDELTIFTYLTIMEAKEENRGRYWIHAENPAGAVSIKLSLIVSENTAPDEGQFHYPRPERYRVSPDDGGD